MKTLHNACCLEVMQGMTDYSVDLLFCDPPYALGSEVIIRLDGKPDYKKAIDFMSAWNQPDGTFWEQWFKEAFRILKHGGRILMFGMDRQLFLNCYYANYAGFTQQQSLYWYSIGGFPKSTDCSKQIDKHFKVERKVIGTAKANTKMQGNNFAGDKEDLKVGVIELTTSTTDLAKKYSSHKYGIAPLKQTCETIMVFQKPCKTSSPLHDILAMENGDNTITASIVDIENNRVATSDVTGWGGAVSNGFSSGLDSNQDARPAQGRFPAQTFVNSAAAERLDLQSGNISSSSKKIWRKKSNGK